MPARGSSRFVRLLFVVAAVLLSNIPNAYSQGGCANKVGRIVSIQGEVQVQRARTVEWISIKGLDVPLCIGDQIRTGLLSRAGLYVSPETIVRLDQNTTLEFVEQTAEQTVVALRREEFNRVVEKRAGQCGVGYFITRFPRKLKVRTPFYNAVVEGTEFQVAMSCDRGELAVFEGKVAAEKLDAPSERVLVEGGQSTSVGAGETPTAVKTLVRPADAVQWALYYLPLSDVKLLTEDALAQDCAALSAELRSGCTIRKAEYLLKVGRVGEARGQLDALSTAEPNNGDVLALQSIIALVQNDKGQALDLATRATQAAPNAFRSFTALSYAQQAHFKLDAALAAAQRAAQLAPASALMKARTAELLLSLGKTRAAERDAKEAVRLDANESRAHLILGFVHLAQIDTKAAKADFGRAIELDSTEPLARLGLGLATIREGKLQEGREQIEIAVALDPTNSLVRSYVGKAYYEENSKARDQLAATQFGLAKTLDPKDPTPWFYDAILKQTQNRPVEALQDLQQSIALNDNRAVYRSSLGLDADAAVRHAAVARIYQDLKLDQLAVSEASTSLALDPRNAAAQQLLADARAGLERQEVGQLSAQLQAQMLQRDGIAFLQPRFAFADLRPNWLSGEFPRGAYEYGNAFARSGLNANLYVGAGSLDTLADQVLVSGRTERWAGAVGQYHFETDGFRDNNRLEQDVYTAFGQFTPNPNFSLQAEGRWRKAEYGDVALKFDPSFFSTTSRSDLDQSTYRLGARISPDGGNWTVLLSVLKTLRDATVLIADPGGPRITSTSSLEGLQGEAQVLYTAPHWNVVAGFYSGRTDYDQLDVLDFTPIFGIPCPPFPPFNGVCSFASPGAGDGRNVYLYGTSQVGPTLLVTLGLSYDYMDDPPQKLETLNPKLGLVWQAGQGLRIRAAAFSAVKRFLAIDQTLEPTQIAGFPQFYDDFNVTHSRVVAAGADLQLASNVAGVVETSRRKVTFRGIEFPANVAKDDPREENLVTAKLNWFPTRNLSLALAYKLHDYGGELMPQDSSPTVLRTTEIPISLVATAGAFLAELTATNVSQHLRRRPGVTAPTGDDRFTVVDAAVRFRLPARKGTISLEVRNLFDQEFFFHDTSFINVGVVLPRYVPTRTVFLSGSLSF